MSTCISQHGEFGMHEFASTGPERFICTFCGSLAEDALFAALDAAEGRARHLALSRADEHTRAHKAEQERDRLRAEAWDEGWCDGSDDTKHRRTMAETTRNPYRETTP